MPVANVSQHLQVLRNAGLVESQRQGTKVFYHLADEGVLRMWLALRSVAESRLAEVERITRDYAVEEAAGPLLSRDELPEQVQGDEVSLLGCPACP